MDDARFQYLVGRLERYADQKPHWYAILVIAVAALGFIILSVAFFYALLSTALVAGTVYYLFFSGAKAIIFLAKLWKLLLVLVLPAWTMVKGSVAMLVSRFPEPKGRMLKPEEAPQLFVQLQEMKRKLNGPTIHKVMLVDQLNAALVQQPRFGLLGWERNYLILGLPMLLALDEMEALAVVAHEYGHLAGSHGRLSGFIYRLRAAWGRLQQLSEQWNDWGSLLVSRLVRWYAPYLNAYTFVLARQHEYYADRAAMETVGMNDVASALMRYSIVNRFSEIYFRPAIIRRISDEQSPPPDHSVIWEKSVAEDLDIVRSAQYLEIARLRATDHLDTHPALSDRLAAMDTEIVDEARKDLNRPRQNAAVVWLGENLATIRGEFDRAWQDDNSEIWQERYDYLQSRRNLLEEIKKKEHPTNEERWERILALEELEPEMDLLEDIKGLLELAPDHLRARFHLGKLMLERGDEMGFQELDAVVSTDVGAAQAACEVAWYYLQKQSSDKASEYLQQWQERFDYTHRVQTELETLPADADLLPANVSKEVTNAVGAIIREHGGPIRRAYLLQRNLKADPTIHDHVLAFEIKRFGKRETGRAIVASLAKQTFPTAIYIVFLGSGTYKRFRKVIRDLRVAPLPI